MKIKKLLSIVYIIFLTVVTIGIFSYINIKTKNIANCERGKSTGNTSNCYVDAAVKKGDTTICDKDPKASSRQTGFCYHMVALSKNDETICDKIIYVKNGEADACYSEIAEKLGDVSICDNIKDNYLNDKCYLDIAISKNEFPICVRINGPELKKECNRYFNVITNDLDSSNNYPFFDEEGGP